MSDYWIEINNLRLNSNISEDIFVVATMRYRMLFIQLISIYFITIIIIFTISNFCGWCFSSPFLVFISGSIQQKILSNQFYSTQIEKLEQFMCEISTSRKIIVIIIIIWSSSTPSFEIVPSSTFIELHRSRMHRKRLHSAFNKTGIQER